MPSDLDVLVRGSSKLKSGAAGGKRPVAVVDIGSNSIRLVVFDGVSRAPTPLFNEKVLCGLGRGLPKDARLNEAGAALALENLQRFSTLSRAMDVARLDMLATAAVRDAVNGAAFVAEVERRCGHPVTVLSGAEEARLSAQGVIAGLPGANGVMGDLGGGSLELVELVDGNLGRSVTLPLGPLRLMAAAGGDQEAARREIDRQLDTVDWLTSASVRGESGDGAGGYQFFPVGGSWRALARIHMEQNHYPLRIIHGYTMSRRDAETLVRVISRLGGRSLSHIQNVSEQRLGALPLAALLMDLVVQRLAPEGLTFSSYGLREGHIFNLLPAEVRAEDPLLLAATAMGERRARFTGLVPQLLEWTDSLFPGETAAARRLRLAACHLCDIAWREHPDYRAQLALQRVLYYPFAAIGHAGRAFLACTVFARYGGSADAKAVASLRALLTPGDGQRARVLGLALRLAYAMSGGSGIALTRSLLKFDNGVLHLLLPDDGSVPDGEVVRNRFDALRRAVDGADSRVNGLQSRG